MFVTFTYKIHYKNIGEIGTYWHKRQLRSVYGNKDNRKL